MDKKILSEITRQHNLMNIQEENLIDKFAQEFLADLLGNVDLSKIDGVGELEDLLKGSDKKLPLTKTTSDDDFYKKILVGVGAPVTPENMKFLYSWRQAEGGKAKYNPFNTTQPRPNSGFYNCLKKGLKGCVAGVRNYATPQDGIDATIKTLKNGKYNNILDALKKGNDAEKSAQALKNSPWGTGELALKVLRGYNSGATPKPPTIG